MRTRKLKVDYKASFQRANQSHPQLKLIKNIMKIIIKITIFAFALVGVTSVLYLSYVIKGIDYNSKIPVKVDCSKLDATFDFDSALRALDLTKIKELFPYDSYLESGAYCDAAAIGNSLEKLNSINPNHERANRSALIHALTNKLEARISDRFDHFNPDSLIILLQWVDEFKTYEKVQPEHSALYGIVYTHWMGFITNQLGKHFECQPAIKFNFKFNYLQSNCQARRFAPAVGMSNLEKVVKYTLGEEYDYLLNRFWNGTGIFTKSVFALLLFIFIYMSYCTYQYNFKK